MATEHEPLLTDSRSYESEEGDVLPRETLEGPVTPMLQQALAEQALESTIEHVEDKNLDAAAALWLLHKETGFYARKNKEKNSMLAVAGRSESGFPTLHYFDVVEYHQRKAHTNDPQAALRSLVRQFERYAVEADAEVRFSHSFADTILKRDFDMNVRLAESIDPEELVYDEWLRRTLISIARLHETDLFVEGKGKNPLGAKAGIDSLEDKAQSKRLFELLGQMKMNDVLNFNERLVKEENSRFEYWKARITEAHMRGSIRAEVDEVLHKLEELRPIAS